MNKLSLNTIIKEKNQIRFDYYVSDGIKKYFSNTPFIIEYPDSIEEVPDSIAAIPFVCNVLPIIWVTDTELRIAELDKAFYERISGIKQAYQRMYPETKFKGKL